MITLYRNLSPLEREILQKTKDYGLIVLQMKQLVWQNGGDEKCDFKTKPVEGGGWFFGDTRTGQRSGGHRRIGRGQAYGQ